MKNGTYIVIQDWMVSELNLKGSELMVYALIHGFSQDGKSWFTGSANYVAEWLGCSTRTVYSLLKKMVDAGQIDKKEIEFSGVKICHYRYLRPVSGTEKTSEGEKEDTPPPEKTSVPPLKKFHTPPEKTSYYKDRDKDRDKDSNTTELQLSAKADSSDPLSDLKRYMREAFQSVTPWSNYPKEQTNLDRLAKGILNLSGPQWREVGSAILSTYLNLVQGADKFWTGQSFTPSGLLPHLDRIFHLARKEMTRGQEIQRLYNEITDAEKDGYRL